MLSITRCCRLKAFDPANVRPGGTLAGPMMIAAASFAMYDAVLGAYGPVEQGAARQLNCNFLRPAAPADLLAEARLIHRGARAAYGEVALLSAADEAAGPVAHVTMTFDVPARKNA